ncbi:hypothetical protein GCM10027176_38310 [Actinoallomurus bryophytorum]
MDPDVVQVGEQPQPEHRRLGVLLRGEDQQVGGAEFAQPRHDVRREALRRADPAQVTGVDERPARVRQRQGSRGHEQLALRAEAPGHERLRQVGEQPFPPRPLSVAEVGTAEDEVAVADDVAGPHLVRVPEFLVGRLVVVGEDSGLRVDGPGVYGGGLERQLDARLAGGRVGYDADVGDLVLLGVQGVVQLALTGRPPERSRGMDDLADARQDHPAGPRAALDLRQGLLGRSPDAPDAGSRELLAGRRIGRTRTRVPPRGPHRPLLLREPYDRPAGHRPVQVGHGVRALGRQMGQGQQSGGAP